MRIQIVVLALALAASVASAGNRTVVLTAEQETALAALAADANAAQQAKFDSEEAARLKLYNDQVTMRDKALPALPAFVPGVPPAPISPEAILLALAKGRLDAKTAQLVEDAAKAAFIAKAVPTLSKTECENLGAKMGVDIVAVCR